MHATPPYKRKHIAAAGTASEAVSSGSPAGISDGDEQTEGKGDQFNHMTRKLLEAIVQVAEERGRELTNVEISNITEFALEAAQDALLTSLIEREKINAADQRRDHQGFSQRNERRWRPALDAMESLWSACAEIGSAFNQHHRPEAVASDDYQFEAIVTLHARCLLVAREAIALVRQGFAEGALARWRTMHEASSIALVVAKADQDVALRYLATFRFQAHQAAVQIDHHIGKGTRDSFTDDEIAAMRAECERLKTQFGVSLTKEFEWSRAALPKISPKQRITFREIEEAAGQAAMRPYYKWASQHNHGGYRPHDKGLGLVEATSPVLLIGPSDGGMVDPLQLVAISLAKATVALITIKPSFDMAVYLAVIGRLSGRVGPLAQEAERVSAERHRKKSEQVRRNGTIQA